MRPRVKPLLGSVFATLIAFGIWVRLLANHEAAVVTPLALLVPAVALTSAAALLGEPLTRATVIGTMLVTLGLAIPLAPGRPLPTVALANGARRRQ